MIEIVVLERGWVTFSANFRGKGCPHQRFFGIRKLESLGYRMVKKIAENFNRLSRVHQRHRQTTDGTAMAYSEREREFTFAKNDQNLALTNIVSLQIGNRHILRLHISLIDFFNSTSLGSSHSSVVPWRHRSVAQKGGGACSAPSKSASGYLGLLKITEIIIWDCPF